MIDLNKEAEIKIRTLMIEGRIKSWIIVLLFILYLFSIPMFLLVSYSTKRDVKETRATV